MLACTIAGGLEAYLIDFDDDITVILNFGDWSVLNGDLSRAVEYNGFHGVCRHCAFVIDTLTTVLRCKRLLMYGQLKRMISRLTMKLTPVEVGLCSLNTPCALSSGF